MQKKNIYLKKVQNKSIQKSKLIDLKYFLTHQFYCVTVLF